MNSENMVEDAAKNTPFWMPILVVLITLCCCGSILAVDMGDSLIKDYPVSLPLMEKKIEVSMDYMLINDTIDVFKIRDKSDSDKTDYSKPIPLSDMSEIKLYLNLGLFTNTTLKSSFHYMNLDYGKSSMKIKGMELSLRQVLLNQRYGWLPFLAIDGGIKFNYAEDMVYEEEGAINAALNKFAPDFSVSLNEKSVSLVHKTGTVDESYQFSRTLSTNPEIINRDLYDITRYLCLTTGKIMGNVFPNLYVEYGNTSVNSTIDFTLKGYMADKSSLFPVNLDRNENYIKAGISILWKFPYSAMAHFEYSFMKVFREKDGENNVDTNHIVKADINYFITKQLILNIGGSYNHRQFNGIIPLLYNEYPSLNFEQRYAAVHFGFTYLLEWK